MAELFRQEALSARSDRLLGDVVIARPLAMRTLVLFLLLLCACIGALVASTTYARRATVSGYLSTAQGIVRINAGRPGIVDELLVEEGGRVAAGSPLLTIRSARVDGDGVGVEPEMIRATAGQMLELAKLEELAIERHRHQSGQLEARIAGLQAEATALGLRIAAQRDLLDTRIEKLARLRRLSGDGFVSAGDVAIANEGTISARQMLAALRQELAAIESDRAQTGAQFEQLPLNLQETLAELRGRRGALEVQRLRLSEQAALTVVAPVAGIVSTASVVVGDAVSNQQHLLTLIPEGSELEAQLFVPARAIGFVAVGDEVRLLYDAYDYRRYGVQYGSVSEVSATVLPVNEFFPRAYHDEPGFRVRVTLSEQVFVSRQRKLSLQPGMTLRADIVLERRTLFDWFAGSLQAFRGRT